MTTKEKKENTCKHSYTNTKKNIEMSPKSTYPLAVTFFFLWLFFLLSTCSVTTYFCFYSVWSSFTTPDPDPCFFHSPLHLPFCFLSHSSESTRGYFDFVTPQRSRSNLELGSPSAKPAYLHNPQQLERVWHKNYVR